MSRDTRATAAQVLAAVFNGQSLNQALPPRLARTADRERAFLQQLCYGTLRAAPRLTALLGQLLDKPLKDKDRDIYCLLLLGLYQLDDSRVPDHAAVAATVDASRALKKKWASGLANAILRRYLREREQLTAELDVAAASAHPPWLYEKLRTQWPGQLEQILAANNQQPPMTLRVNALQCSREAYLAKLSEAAIPARPGNLSDNAITLDKPVDVGKLPGFYQGLVSVQDEGAQLAAGLLQPSAGERILDACAAPGGKACHLLELQPDLSALTAMDSDSQRLQRVEENLERLGLNAGVVCGDAAKAVEVLGDCEFDRILVDAPCSATGVIRRHPDIKVLRRAGDIAQFAGQQLAILSGLWPLLRGGGTLLYVTCSVMEEENSGVMQQFLAAQAGAELLPVEESWGERVNCGRQLLPVPGENDGLFFALLRKTG